MSKILNKSGIPQRPDVAVVGGGLAGLTAAAIVAAAGKTVVVHEKRSVVGGDAPSTIKKGFTLNQGPHALYKCGSADRALTDLGVRISGAKPPTKGGLVFDRRPEIAPAGPLQTRALKLKDKVEVGKVLTRLPKLRPSNYSGVTVKDWIDDIVSGERPAEVL